MKFHIITIFPESFTSFLETSIIGRARNKWLLEVKLYKLNHYAEDTSGHVDEKAYGMHGQVLSAIPLSSAIEDIFKKIWQKVPVIFMTPSGQKLEQKLVENFAESAQEYIIICGHYEGIDQRIIELYVDYEISLGDYILTGWELAAQIFIDSVTRLKSGVLWSDISHEEESFSKKLGRQKEYPVYTRPQEFMWKKVPDILISWNHKKIEDWKKNNLR